MNQTLSRNSQIILMLTAPLAAGRGDPSVELLSLAEYNRLARLLRDQGKQPSDLIGPAAPELIGLAAPLVGAERLEALLNRGFLLSQAVEYWNARAIWVVSRADADYPARLKTNLKGHAPPVLYGCGEMALIDKGGGAVSVLAGGLEAAALARENRRPLMEGRRVFVSPVDPQAFPDDRSAIERDKVVRALDESPAEAGDSRPTTASPAERLLDAVRAILIHELAEPRTEAEAAALLAVSKAQTHAWLRKLVDAGALSEGPEPGQYHAARKP